ncbi:MAG: hypothetical protein KKH41_08250 [Candidatus Thermoplasmatota archaeon]|nr:hypothetical protein [Euryarchaeota archaeon]MBU4032204.1 hypothetical protein [Candidatus Thermoplasmatota archaeon]MBU4071814.1 hypothetical protein [Candidatus Thermoplasmatota archaeon]MBU4143949.1 hypothetical protein [Candidatus Thermoplasmatota archaeon]MBU4592556.1 hypothetical protein [Candidatus Thermoplasmatota archaeon]
MKLFERLSSDRNGAVEGLPLQLIIMVAVAAIVLVIVLGWLAPWQNKADLNSLTASPQTVANDEEITIVITAWDTKGNHLEGVVIEMSGCNVGTQVLTTGANGTATFTVTPSIPPNTTNNINIVGKFTGTVYTEKTAFVVVS